MRKFCAVALALSFSLTILDGALAKGNEPPKLSWQDSPMVAPWSESQVIRLADDNTPFIATLDGSVSWNPLFWGSFRSTQNYRDLPLVKIGNIDTKGLSAQKLSDLLSRCPDSTVLTLQTTDPLSLKQLPVKELRDMIYKNAPGGEPSFAGIHQPSINNSFDYRSCLIYIYTGDINDIAQLHSYATYQYPDGDTPPLDFDASKINVALQFSDRAGYYELTKELIVKAEQLSLNPIGDFSFDKYLNILGAAKYLARTGRLEAANKIYQNLLKTAFDWGVVPAACSNLLLDYANFLKYQGKEKEAEPFFQELELRIQGERSIYDCYGMAGGNRSEFLPLAAQLLFFRENRFWAPLEEDGTDLSPVESGNLRLATKGADKSSLLNAPGRLIFSAEVGRGTEWQSTYQTYKLISEHDFVTADKCVQAMLQAEQKKYTHNAIDLGRLKNLATAYEKAGQKQRASDLRISLLSLTSEPRQANTRAEILFELAYSFKSDTKLADQYLKLLEGTAHDYQEHYKDCRLSTESPLPAAQVEQQKDHAVFKLLSEMSDLYFLLDQPDKAIYIADQAIKRHSLDAFEKVALQVRLSKFLARERLFDKSSAILNAIVCDNAIIAMCPPSSLADTISEIRLQGNLSLARHLVKTALANGDIGSEPLSFQLGLIDLEEKDFHAAEKNFRHDLERSGMSNFTSVNIVAALVHALIEQGRYEEAFDALVQDSRSNFFQSHATDLLITILPHINTFDQQKLSQLVQILWHNNEEISSTGHASHLQALRKLADSKPDWPTDFSRAVKQWSASYFPAAKRQPPFAAKPETATIIETPSQELDEKDIDASTSLQRAEVEISLGESNKAVDDIVKAIKSRSYINTAAADIYHLQKLTSAGRVSDVETIREALVNNSTGVILQRHFADLATFYIQQKKYPEAELCISKGMETISALPPTLDMHEIINPWLETVRTCKSQYDYAIGLKILQGIQKVQTRWLGPMNYQQADILIAKAELESLMGEGTIAREDVRHGMRIKKLNEDIVTYSQDREELLSQYGATTDAAWWSETDSEAATQIIKAREKDESLRCGFVAGRFIPPDGKPSAAFIEAKRSGKLGVLQMAEALEESAASSAQNKDFNEARRKILIALNIREGDEGKCNYKRSLLMQQLACLDALAGKKERAREWRSKARQAQTIGENHETKWQSEAYDACASTLLGQKKDARVMATRALEATHSVTSQNKAPYEQACILILTLIGQEDEATKWSKIIADRARTYGGQQVYPAPPPSTAMITSLMRDSPTVR